jgi:hypothetical protein
MLFRFPRSRIANGSSTRKQHLVDYSQILANAVVLVALPFTVLTYCHQIDTEKVSRSLDYVKEFNTGTILDARNVLFTIWQRGDQANAELPADVLAEMFDRLAERQGERPGPTEARQAVSDIANFFDMVDACRAAGPCDDESLQTNLGQYAHDFWCIYQSSLKEQRSRIGNKTLGGGLERLAEARGGC